MFKEPHHPTRVLKDNQEINVNSVFDDGFKKFVPVESLVYKEVLVKAFGKQCHVQETFNFEKVQKGEHQPYASIVNKERVRLIEQQQSMNTNLSSSSLDVMAGMVNMAGIPNPGPGLLPTPPRPPVFNRLPSSQPPAYPGVQGQSQHPVAGCQLQRPGMYQQSVGMQPQLHPMSPQQGQLQTDFGQPPGMASGMPLPHPSQGMPQHQERMMSQQQQMPYQMLNVPGQQSMSSMLGHSDMGMQISKFHDPRVKRHMSAPSQMAGALDCHLTADNSMGMDIMTSASLTSDVISGGMSTAPPGYMHSHQAVSSYDSSVMSTSVFDSSMVDTFSQSHSATSQHSMMLSQNTTRDIRFTGQNLHKSLSVGTTPLTGSTQTPGVTTMGVTKPRPTEGRTADTSSDPMQGLGTDKLTPSEVVAAIQMPPPKSPIRDFIKNKDLKENVEPVNEETELMDANMDTSQISPGRGSPISPGSLFATKRLIGDLIHSPGSETEMTDDLADKIVHHLPRPSQDPRKLEMDMPHYLPTPKAPTMYIPTPKSQLYEPTPRDPVPNNQAQPAYTHIASPTQDQVRIPSNLKKYERPKRTHHNNVCWRLFQKKTGSHTETFFYLHPTHKLK